MTRYCNPFNVDFIQLLNKSESDKNVFLVKIIFIELPFIHLQFVSHLNFHLLFISDNLNVPVFPIRLS